MRGRVAWVAVLACLSCSDDDSVGDDAGAGGAATGGTTSNTGGRTPAGGGGATAGGGTTSITGGRSSTGGVTASGGAGGADQPDASVDGGSVDGGDIDAGRDGAGHDATTDAGRSACVANHRMPGGRYRLKIHSVYRHDDADDGCSPQNSCSCGNYAIEETDGEGVISLEDDFTTLLDTTGPAPVSTPMNCVAGSLEEPLLRLFPGIAGDARHVETYPRRSDFPPDGWPLDPCWFPSQALPKQGLPDPYTVISSSPDCFPGSSNCTGQDFSGYFTRFELDTSAWTVKFTRHAELAGICAYPRWIVDQTGTGELECGDGPDD